MSQQVVLPSKPKIISESDTRGVYEIDGFYPGYGHTIGNSLRRIILSSLPGAAITQVRIAGAQHEFSTIEGVKEDVIVILLNLKKVRAKLLTDEPQTLKLNVKGPKVVTAGDIEAPGQVEILNKDEYIAEITGKVELDIEMTLESGLGYVPKESIVKERLPIGTITLDAAFSPIRRVNYEVENMRVGDRTDFNKLRISIETDGTLTAREALEDSIAIMIKQLKAIVGFKEEDEELADDVKIETPKDAKTEKKKPASIDKEVLKTRIEELNLSQRLENALGDAGIRTIGGLARKHSDDVLAIPGLGEKGLQEIKQALSKYGITLRS